MFLIIFILLFERLLSDHITSITITGLSCQVPHLNKTDCAPSGYTDPTSCEQSGCCYEPVSLPDVDIPWCFHGVPITTTIINYNYTNNINYNYTNNINYNYNKYTNSRIK